MRRVSALRRAVLLITGAMLAATVIGGAASPAAAQPVGTCKNLRSFVLDFRTGGDDLRGNSEVIVWLMTTAGDVELQHVWGAFGNHSSNSRSVTFQNPNWTVNACTVSGVKIRMISHPGAFEHDDNWNMDGFTIFGYSGTGAYAYYLSATGTPVKRFTGSDPWWSTTG